MTTRWTWALEKFGYGPDGFLFVRFPTNAGEHIAAVFESVTVPGYLYDAPDEPQVFYSQGAALPCAMWIDEHGFAQSKRQGNVWHYGLIRCHRHLVEVETGYLQGGDRAIELDVIRQLVHRANCDLEWWQIYAGGQGYEWKLWAEGAGIDSLYIQAMPPEDE